MLKQICVDLYIENDARKDLIEYTGTTRLEIEVWLQVYCSRASCESFGDIRDVDGLFASIPRATLTR